MKTLLSMAFAAGLAACGGGGSDAPPADRAEVPASAGASPEAYVLYTQAMARATDDTAEALGLAMIGTPPTTESADPVDFD